MTHCYLTIHQPTTSAPEFTLIMNEWYGDGACTIQPSAPDQCQLKLHTTHGPIEPHHIRAGHTPHFLSKVTLECQWVTEGPDIISYGEWSMSPGSYSMHHYGAHKRSEPRSPHLVAFLARLQ